MRKNAYIYARWSTDEQSGGTTLARQLYKCRTYAESKGYKIVAELLDDGLSAYSGHHLKKGKLGKFTASLNVGDIIGSDVILIAEEMDRLSRQDAPTATNWFLSIFSTGLQIEITNSSKVLNQELVSNDMGGFFSLISDNFTSHSESKKKSERIREFNKLKREALRSGAKPKSLHRCPAWLKIVDSDYEPIADRVEIVNEIFSLAMAGNGKDTIARLLNEKMNAGDPKYDTWRIGPKSKAKKWTASKIGRILYQQQVIGYWQPYFRPRIGQHKPDGEPIKLYPVVVDIDIYNAVNEPREKRQLAAKGKGKNVANFLAGKCVCWHCKGPMVGRGSGRKKTLKDGTKTRYYSYYCENAKTGGGCDIQRGWSIPKLEKVLMDMLLVRAMDDQYFVNPAADIITMRKAVNETKRKVQAKSDHFKALLRDTAALGGSQEIEDVKIEVSNALTKLRETLLIQEAELAEQSGKVSQSEHVRRVAEVRDMIWSDEPDEEYKARMTIKAALQDIIEFVEFDDDTDNIIVHIVGGISQLIVIDNGRDMSGVFMDFESMANGSWRNHPDADIIAKYVERAQYQSA